MKLKSLSIGRIVSQGAVRFRLVKNHMAQRRGNMRKRRKAGVGVAVMLACTGLLGGCGLKKNALEEWIPFGARGLKGEIEQVVFEESDRKLNNPNRGFYQLYEFLITDEETDYKKVIGEWYPKGGDISLMFIQINLQSYREGEISPEGLANIERLFGVLETCETQLIVRFVYDREGKAGEYEPGSLEVILGHMEQLESTLKRHCGQIFIVQGVFTGNWGEMNGSRYDTKENWRILAAKLAQVTDVSTYLSVRTPAQWRSLISIGQVPKGGLPYTTRAFDMEETSGASPLWGRLGLFNDGMFGNEKDFGTYGEYRVSDRQWEAGWQREEELAFQDALCRLVPNGGETIVENPYNDLPNALKDMEAMHVTYLNKWHDPAVLDKWANTVVEEDGCFNGMDGYSYVERHLGYRLLIDSAQLTYKRSGSRLSVKIRMKNMGFAPVYRDTELKLLIHREGSGEEPLAYPVEGRLGRLAGGKDAEDVLSLQKEIDMKEFPEGRYGIYFSVMDSESQREIYLANQQNPGEYGYCLGFLELSQ